MDLVSLLEPSAIDMRGVLNSEDKFSTTTPFVSRLNRRTIHSLHVRVEQFASRRHLSMRIRYPMMKSQKASIISLLVVIILLGSIFYPMALTYPYSETSKSYAVVHESTETFNQTIVEANISISNPTPVRDLSPNAQRTFKQAKDQPEDEYNWQRTKGIVVCSDALLVCDKPTEPRNFLSMPRIAMQMLPRDIV